MPHSTQAVPHSKLNSPSRTHRILADLNLNHLNAEEKKHVEDLVEQNTDLFHIYGDKLSHTKVFEHKIKLTDDITINTKQYRYPPIHRQEIGRQMKELLENDIVTPSTSSYNSPLWIVPKKPNANGNKRWRMVIDYRALNEKNYP